MTLALNDILNNLMFERKIRTAALARQTHLPQATVQRIVTGITPNPHADTLKKIAEYFNITTDQLKGLQPIPWLSPQRINEAGWYKIPLLTWEESVNWKSSNNIQTNSNEYISTDANCNNQCFALKIKDSSMEPQFPKDTIIVIDSAKEPKDRSFVIAKIAGYQESIFRQLLIDGPNKYLKPISPDFDRFKMSLMGKNDYIIGVLIQARRNYEE